MWIAALGLALVLVACSAEGTEGQVLGQPGPEGVIGSGIATASGTPWELSVRRSGENQVCLSITGGGEGCVSIPDGDRPLEGLFSGGGRGPETAYVCVFGMVAPIVARVEVLFADGQQIPAQLFPGNGWQVDFFALCRGDDSIQVDRLSLLDSDGNFLGDG